jgi:hypothetical protein
MPKPTQPSLFTFTSKRILSDPTGEKDRVTLSPFSSADSSTSISTVDEPGDVDEDPSDEDDGPGDGAGVVPLVDVD